VESITQPRTKEESFEKISHLSWDVPHDAYDIYLCAFGTLENIGQFHQRSAFQRCLTNCSWENMLFLFGISRIKNLLTEEVIQTIWPNSVQKHFADIRFILQRETLSISGLSPSFGDGPRPVLVSDRWYRT